MIHILFDVDSILFYFYFLLKFYEHSWMNILLEREYDKLLCKSTLFMRLVVNKYENGLICCLFQFLF